MIQRFETPAVKPIIVLLPFMLILFSFQTAAQKINGVFINAPERELNSEKIISVKSVNANYVELCPLALSKSNKPMVFFDKPTQYWGERREGIEALVKAAHKNGLQVFLNPKVFIEGSGPPVDFNLKDDVTWKKWEANYMRYIISYAELAQKNKVELFSIGSNFNNAVAVRKSFFLKLIMEVRKVYSGKITYAASYNDVSRVSFWNELDYIGVNAYYPLSANKTPVIKELVAAWKIPKQQLHQLSLKYNRQVLFTEWGYRSIDKCAGNQSELPDDFIYLGNANINAQAAAFACLLTVFQNEKWYAGGFCYRWYLKEKAGGNNNNDYTPQNKLAAEILKRVYFKRTAF